MNTFPFVDSITLKTSTIIRVLLWVFFRYVVKSDDIFDFSDFIRMGYSTAEPVLLNLVLDFIEKSL